MFLWEEYLLQPSRSPTEYVTYYYVQNVEKIQFCLFCDETVILYLYMSSIHAVIADVYNIISHYKFNHLLILKFWMYIWKFSKISLLCFRRFRFALIFLLDSLKKCQLYFHEFSWNMSENCFHTNLMFLLMHLQWPNFCFVENRRCI